MEPNKHKFDTNSRPSAEQFESTYNNDYPSIRLFYKRVGNARDYAVYGYHDDGTPANFEKYNNLEKDHSFLTTTFRRVTKCFPHTVTLTSNQTKDKPLFNTRNWKPAQAFLFYNMCDNHEQFVQRALEQVVLLLTCHPVFYSKNGVRFNYCFDPKLSNDTIREHGGKILPFDQVIHKKDIKDYINRVFFFSKKGLISLHTTSEFFPLSPVIANQYFSRDQHGRYNDIAVTHFGFPPNVLFDVDA